jgi:uridine kinase
LPSDPSHVAASVAGRVLTEPPTLGPGRLVCIDGPAGSGKTTLAAALEAAVDDVVVIHCDELLKGWGGLPGLAATVEALLAPLAAGRTSHWTRWDWLADGWAEDHPVEPGGLLVLEGVGSWSPAISDLVGVLVWVEAGPDLRLDRGIARDGEAMREHWQRWQVDEQELHETSRTRDNADLVVSTDG